MDVPVYPATLWELLDGRAGTDPDRILLEDDRGRSLTVRQWRDQALRVAAGLHDRGVGTGTVVSWQLPTRLDSPVLLMALARLGAVQNPVIPILRRREVGFIVAQTGAQLLVAPGVYRGFDHTAMAHEIAREMAAEHPLEVLDVGEAGLPVGDPASLPPPPTGEGDPVRHIYYSSGSTADPKGARHTDSSVMNAANGTILGYEVGPDDCIPIPFPYTHIGGMAMTVVSLYTGARMLLIETFNAKDSPLVMAERGGTILGSAVPFFHAYIEAQRAHGLQPLFTRLKCFASGGAPKPPELYYEMKELFGTSIVSSWGLTEFPIATVCTLDDSDEDLAATEGRVVPGVELRVVGPDGEDVSAGEEGELRLRGPQMCRGYVDASLDADARDEKGFFRTGDLGVVGPRGHVRITGRIKDVIIRNAENISAQEIENVLYTHPKVADVAVIGLPDARTGERACAVVVLAEGQEGLTLAELAEFCRAQELANQKIPERLEIVPALPRNALGKILKQELRRTYRDVAAPTPG